MAASTALGCTAFRSPRLVVDCAAAFLPACFAAVFLAAPGFVVGICLSPAPWNTRQYHEHCGSPSVGLLYRGCRMPRALVNVLPRASLCSSPPWLHHATGDSYTRHPDYADNTR